MVHVGWFSVFLVLHAAHSYILLTANLDDVHKMAQQLAESPVADQLKRIWRRAYTRFNENVGDPRGRNRADDIPVSDLIVNIAKQLASSPVVEQAMGVWRRAYEQFTDLAATRNEKHASGHNDVFHFGSGSGGQLQRRNGFKNESFYLKSIKKILDDV